MKVITAIIAILILEALALYQGVDGTVFSIAIAAIAGLGGYAIKKKEKSE